MNTAKCVCNNLKFPFFRLKTLKKALLFLKNFRKKGRGGAIGAQHPPSLKIWMNSIIFFWAPTSAKPPKLDKKIKPYLDRQIPEYAEAQLGPPFRKFFKKKSAFLRVWSQKTEILSCCMQIWLCSIQIDFLFLCFYKIYTSNSCKMNDMSQLMEYLSESQKSIF